MLSSLVTAAFGQAFPVGSIELPDLSHADSRLTAGPIASVYSDFDATDATWIGSEVEARLSAGPFGVSADLLGTRFQYSGEDYDIDPTLLFGGAAFTSWRVMDTDTLRLGPFGSHQFGTFAGGDWAYSKAIGAVLSAGRPEYVAIHVAVPVAEIALPSDEPFALGILGSQLGLTTVQGRHEIGGLLGILAWTSRYRYVSGGFTFDVSWSTQITTNTLAAHVGAHF